MGENERKNTNGSSQTEINQNAIINYHFQSKDAYDMVVRFTAAVSNQPTNDRTNHADKIMGISDRE